MSTFEDLCELIAKEYPVEAKRLQPDTILEDLEIDSLGQLELMFSIEDHFDVRADDKVDSFETLQDVVDYIDQLLARKAAPSATP